MIRKELGVFFQKNAASSICMGAMVSVTTVRMSPDLSIAKIYLSILVARIMMRYLKNYTGSSKFIRHQLSQIVKNQLRKTPELHFYSDDSLDYAEKIEELK